MKKGTLILMWILWLLIATNQAAAQGIADVLQRPSIMPPVPAGDADMQPLYNLGYLGLSIWPPGVPPPLPTTDASLIYSIQTGVDSHWMVLQTTNDANDHIVLQPSGNVGIITPPIPLGLPWWAFPRAKLHVASLVKTTVASPVFLLEEGPQAQPLKDYVTPTGSAVNAVEIEAEPDPLPLGSPPYGCLMVYFGDGLSHFDSYLGYTFGIRGSEQVRITNAGNVGIGTTTPTAKLQVTGTTLISNGGLETIFGTASKPGYRFMGSGVNTGMFAPAANELGFSTNSAERMRIDSAGNIGIGTTAPSAKLDIESDKGTYPSLIQLGGNAPGNVNVRHYVYLGSGYHRSHGITVNYNLDSGAKDAATLSALAFGLGAGGTGGSFPGGGFTFDYMPPKGSSWIRAMQIDHETGNVGIGTTSPTQKLDVDGTARLRQIAAGSGTTVVVDAAGKLWKSSSSKKYKTNIVDLEADPGAVLDLRPVRFQWATTGQEDIGLIAEEVAQSMKDLVIYDQEGRPDAVKYDRIALYLLSVVKAQQQKIAELETAQAENRSLARRLDALEQMVQQQKVVAKQVQQ